VPLADVVIDALVIDTVQPDGGVIVNV